MKKNSRSSNNSRTAKNLRQLKRRLSRRQKASAEFQYGTLEPKLPLDASFSYSDANGGFLSFSNFTLGESVFVDLNNDGDLVASLQNGTWQGGFGDPDDGTNAGQFLIVEGDFDDFSISGLADESVLTFGSNADFSDADLRISSAADFTVLATPSGGNQSGFDVAELQITGGTVQLFDNGSEIENLIVSNVNSFEYITDSTITTEFVGAAPGGFVTLQTDGDVILDSVNVPGTFTLLADGNVTRDNRDNDVVANQFFLGVDGDVTIENLRVTEISGAVDGDFTITDSNNNFANLTDTTITADFVPGFVVRGDLDWTIRGTSLTQNTDAPLMLSELDRIIDSPFLGADEDAGTATFRVTPFDQTESILLAESDLNDFGEVNVVSDFPDGIIFFLTDTQVPRTTRFNALEFSDSDDIVVGDLHTSFIPSDLDQNGTGTFDSRVRISAGRSVVAGEDFPVLARNEIGSITITGQIESENLLLQSPGIFDASGADIDTHNLFLGGDTENEGRANFQVVADSLQNLSVNVFDSFDVVSQQELRIGAGQYLGLNTFNPEAYTIAFANEFAGVESTRLDFDVPFTSRKLVADVVTDIEQAAGAVVIIDELSIEAKRTILDNEANDFQRIAVLGDGFADIFTDGISNNDEDVLVIRDLGTLEIASLDDQPIDALATNFDLAPGDGFVTAPGVLVPVPTVINGISIDGTVDIITGFGGDVTEPRIGGPTAEQIGPTGRIERFSTVPGRTDIVFRDDNYDGSVRPAYFIEFIYDGTSDLAISSDAFERRDPERVRGELDVELALYNETGDLLAVDDDDSNNEFDVLNLADIDPAFLFNGDLPAGRYYVAASAFATEFEDGFVVNTSNNLTGTLNVTIANGAGFVAPEIGRDLTQQPTAPLIVTGGEEDGDIEDGEPDGSVVLSALGGGAILLAETDLNDVRELTVNEAVGIEFTDFDDAVIVSNVTEPYEFARLSVGRGADGGVLTIGDFAADELLIQADTGVVSNGELNVPRLLLGGPESRDSGGDLALISPNTSELAFQFVNEDTDFALATNQDLVIGAFQSQGGVLIGGSIGDEIRLQANSLTINSPLEATTKLVVEVEETLVVDASTFVGAAVNTPVVDPANQLGDLSSGSFILIDTLLSTGDPELTLFNSAGVVVAQNDNVFDNDFFSESQIMLDSVPDGTYFLAVSSADTTADNGFNVVGGNSPLTFQLLANGFPGEGTLAANEVSFFSFTVGAPDSPADGAVNASAITTDQLFFTGATLDLSQVENQIGQIAASITGDDGDFQLQSSIATTVANLNNQIDIGILPISETLNFNSVNTLDGVSTRNDLDFNVVRLTQDADTVIQGRTLTINTTGGVGDTTVPTNRPLLPTGPEVDQGTQINNDVDPSIAGSFQATVGDGNGVLSSSLAYEQIDGALTTGNLVFNYTTYVRVGNTTTNLGATTITQAATLIADDVVESRGNFAGPNGLVNWIATSRFDNGVANFLTTVALEADAGTTLGDIQVISYLDEDIVGVGDDFLTTTGTPGEADFRAFTLDGPNRVGFSHGGFYSNDGANQINATYAGWSADQFAQLQTAIQGSTQEFSITGEIDLSDLPPLSDPDFSAAFGPSDVTTAFAWNTNATATNSTVTSFLEFLPTVDAVVGNTDPDQIPPGDVLLGENNSVTNLVITAAQEVVFNNDRQLVVETIDANENVQVSTTAGDIAVDVLSTPGAVTLNAADDIRDVDPLDGNRVAGSTLNLVAGNINNESPQFNGILLQTDVNTINADINSTESGDFIIRELTDVNLNSVVAGNGVIDVVAIGSIFANNVSHTTQNANNTITFNAVGEASDIGVGLLSSGGAGDIRLIAGDDVNHIIPALIPDPVFQDGPVVDPVDSPVVNLPVIAPANQLGSLPAIGAIQINTDDSPVDPELTLYNSSGDALFNTTNAIGIPRILTSLPADTYFLAVSGFNSTVGADFQVVGGNTSGDFNLNINDDISTNGTLAIGEVIFFSFTVGTVVDPNVPVDPPVVDPVTPTVPTGALVTGEDLFVLAFNETADEGSGIDLNTNVVSAHVQVGIGPDQNPNAGSITINETNGLRLEYAKTRLGTINVTTGADNLVSEFVQAEGVNLGDAITLNANGAGADVVTNEVRVRLSSGGVAINAADDIRDVNSSDDKFIIARSVTLNAGNNTVDNFNGIIAQTRTNLISAQVTSESEASLFVFNQIALRVEDTFVTNGNIGITNSRGNLQAIDVRSGGEGNSRVFLRTLGLGSDISITRIEAADRGEIFLNSADDIFDSVFADELFVTAEFLSATANNNAIETFDGVILNADVDSLSIAQPNGGERFVRQF